MNIHLPSFTIIYQLFWVSLGVRVLTHSNPQEFELRVKPNGRSLGMGTCRSLGSTESMSVIHSVTQIFSDPMDLYNMIYLSLPI